MLSERQIRRGLKTKSFGNKIYTFKTIDSTNNCARTLAGVGVPEGVVVISEEQTAGRGRLGRTWESAPEENLMFSIVLRPRIEAESLNLLPLYVGVALAQAIEEATALKVECKWPNDLLINHKKVAGILIESSMKQNHVEYVVIGVGINVNQKDFPPHLKPIATSLYLEAHRPIDRVQLLRTVLTVLERHYTASATRGFESIVPFWQERSTMINKPITVSQSGTVISGIVKGLSKEGGLVLRVNGSETTLFAGDVTILRGDAPEVTRTGPSSPLTSH